jgi:hypothetical protein
MLQILTDEALCPGRRLSFEGGGEHAYRAFS